jgi:predicted cupin superfamily sugar epimerase
MSAHVSMHLPNLADLVNQLNLTPHPEGGFYRETYRSTGVIPHSVLPAGFKGDRNTSTAIYYLLPEGACSRFHRIASDEGWHLYLGGPLDVVQLDPVTGELTVTTLGANLAKGETFQAMVPAGVWFGAQARPGCGYALVGCTVAPGFDFDDFELATRSQLLADFPEARSWIERLTPES